MTQNAPMAAPAAGAKTAKSDPIAAFLAEDAAVMLGLPFLTAVSWMLPEGRWRGFARAVAPLAVSLHTGNPDALVETIRRTLGPRVVDRGPRAILEELSASRILAILQLLRCYRPGGWNPTLHLVGKEHLDAALAEGRGAILWVANSEFGDLPAKMAFHEAGLEVSHLSRASHGFSETKFGMRYLNRIQTLAEDRYLRARFSLSTEGTGAALRTLAGRLGANGVVSFTVHRNAKRPVVVPFLEGEITLAPGAPVMAWKTKAALLPAFAFLTEDGAFGITIEALIEVPDDPEGGAAVEPAVRAYAARLEPHLLSYPGQWSGWLHL